MCHYTYMWKINWAFFGLPFQNRTSISEWSFDFKMELRFRNEALISKSSFDFKMGLQFPNGGSILKWSFDFEMELRFQNRASISKCCFDFEMENGTVVLKSKTLLICLQVTTWKNASRAIEESLTERIGKWRTTCGVARGKGVFIKYLQHVLLEKEMDQSSSIFFNCVYWLFLTNRFLPKLNLIVMVAS